MSGMRKSTPRGQMTRGANSGPAIMLLPPHLRSTFMPNPPLEHIPPTSKRRKQQWSGMSSYLVHFEKTPPPQRVVKPTPLERKQQYKKLKQEKHINKLKPLVEAYRKEQRELGGEYEGMNCYNTLFVGRLAYEVSERKLLREMESFGPIKDIKIVKDTTKDGRSRGYGFVEYEHEEDMKRAYRAADGMRIDGRPVVVDVERGHTVPSWLPRRLGGGLGGTRLGGKDVNVLRPGRFDPSRPEASVPMLAPVGMGRGGGPPPPQPYGGYGGGRGGGFRGGPPPPMGGPPMGGPPMGGPPPYGRGGGGDRYGGGRDYDRGGGGGRYGGGGGGDYHRKRHRSPSPDRRHDRRRY